MPSHSDPQETGDSGSPVPLESLPDSGCSVRDGTLTPEIHGTVEDSGPGKQSSPEGLKGRLQALSEEDQLEYMVNLLQSAADNLSQQLVEVAKVWNHLVTSGIWKLKYETVEGLKLDLGWDEDMWLALELGVRSVNLYSRVDVSVRSEWGCSIEDLFEQDDRPSTYSKHFLEELNRVLPLCSREVGIRQILKTRDKRRKQRNGAKTRKRVTPKDIKNAVESIRMGTAALNARPPHVSAGRGPHPDKDYDPTISGSRQSLNDQCKPCDCPATLAPRLLEAKRGTAEYPRLEAVAIAEQWLKEDGGLQMCHTHARHFARDSFSLCNNVTNSDLKKRIAFVLKYTPRHTLSFLQANRQDWFRAPPGKEPGGEKLGLWRWVPAAPIVGFFFEPEHIFERFANPGSWDKWLDDGNVILSDVFKYLCSEDIFQFIDAEFEMFQYHTKICYHGKWRNGWTRTMFYSLIQQLVRQDPLYYALMVAARPDRNWRLISYPYYTKATVAGESTGFKHLDLNVPALLKDGRGANIIQSTLSLDDEDDDGCTVLVPGFHRNIREWWARVEARGQAADSLTTNVSKTYLKEDEEKFGTFVPVPCPRGGIRISRPEIIHGSTPRSPRLRRTIFVWHCGIKGDHEGLDNEESETWEEIARCHRDMVAPARSTSGYGFAYGKPGFSFPASVRLSSTSAIGDAMIGLRRWNDISVIRERDVLFGPDDAKALEYVAGVRVKLLESYRSAFWVMAEAEKNAYGEYSYFRDPAMARLRAARENDLEREGGLDLES